MLQVTTNFLYTGVLSVNTAMRTGIVIEIFGQSACRVFGENSTAEFCGISQIASVELCPCAIFICENVLSCNDNDGVSFISSAAELWLWRCCADDDDEEWTQVSTGHLQHADTDTADSQADTNTADNEAQVLHDQQAVKSSDNSQTQNVTSSSGPAAIASSLSSSSDAPDTQQVDESLTPTAAAAAEPCSADVIGAPADAVAGQAASTDRDSVVSSLSSDQTKSDSLVVVAATPERTSPSDESSNAKGWFPLL